MLDLSLCMIVKNEEHVLRRCLKSVKDIVDEIIIADTGSTDNTIKIAAEFTDSIYEYEWTDSFSDARNFVQTKASGKWILVLDADEFVDRDNLINFKNKLIEQEVAENAFAATIYNFTGAKGDHIVQHNSPRIYRNNGELKYNRTIHEQLAYLNGEYVVSKMCDLIIYHSGYLKEEMQNKDKSSRNKKLLEKQKSDAGQTAFDYYNMGNEFLSLGNIEKALESFQKAYLNKKDINLGWVPLAVVEIAVCLINLKRYKEALSVIADAESIWINAPEFLCLKGQVYFLQNRYDGSKEQLLFLLENKDRYNGIIKSIDFVELHPYIYLGYIYEKEGDLARAISNYAHVLSVNKTNLSIIERLLSILSKNCPKEEVISFIEGDSYPKKGNILNTIKILLNISQFELAEHFINQIDNNVQIKEGMLLKLDMLKGKYTAAIDCFENLSDIDLNRIANEGFFDYIDMFLLYLLTKNALIFSRLEKTSGNKDILDFLQNSIINTEQSKNLFLLLVDRSIKYQKFEIFEELMSKTKNIDSNAYLVIGHILCNYGFNEVSLNFYEKVNDIKLLDETAFVNIIDVLVKQNDKENALLYAIKGIEMAYTDYRIFKNAIELSIELNKEDIKTEIVKLASKQYDDSKWLKNQLSL
jgi:glycosyltransferase involved in cell wall biosynthesis